MGERLAACVRVAESFPETNVDKYSLAGTIGGKLDPTPANNDLVCANIRHCLWDTSNIPCKLSIIHSAFQIVF